MHDLDGLPFTGSGEALAAFNSAVTAVHALTPDLGGQMESAVAADPGQPLVRALRAVLAMPFGLAVDPVAEIAAALAQGASDRERSFLAAADRFVNHSPGAAAVPFLEHLSRWPADTAASLPAYVATMATGDRSVHDLLELVSEKQFAAAPGWRTAHGAAFQLMDRGNYDDAATVAWEALGERPDGGLVVHVLAHWHYETGAHSDGREWLDEWRTGREFTLYPSHFAWHSALHALAAGDGELAGRLLVEEMPDVAIPDVGSLRWRLRLAGPPVPDRAAASEFALETAHARNTPMVAWNAACASAADGDVDEVHQIARMVRSWPMPAAELLGRVIDSLAHGAASDWVSCAGSLEGLTAPALRDLGGSRAQREVFEDTRILALIRCDRLDEARVLLEERLARRDHAVDRSWLQRCGTAAVSAATVEKKMALLLLPWVISVLGGSGSVLRGRAWRGR